MISSLFTRIHGALYKFQQTFVLAFGKKYPPDAFCVLGIEINQVQALQEVPAAKFSLKNIVGDGFLWAVPKHRRTIERRLKRKFGHSDYILKILKPRNDLRICNVCGDDHEAGVLCPTCYKKVIDETKCMQDAIQNELKLEPVEKEVVVLYENEKADNPSEFFEGKRIVEMKKPRPSWFSNNLLQQTTQKGATTSDVKPSDLG